MSDLGFLEGRARPRVVACSLSLEIREESWVVKARVEEEGAAGCVFVDLLGRGWPYNEVFCGMMAVLMLELEKSCRNSFRG